MKRKRKKRTAKRTALARERARVARGVSGVDADFVNVLFDGFCAALLFGAAKRVVDEAFDRPVVVPRLDDGKTVEAEFEVVGDGKMVKR